MTENEKPSIDEQLAQARREFDQRLASEGKAQRKAEAAEIKVLPKPAKVRPLPPKRKVFAVGEVAHSHYKETDEEILEVPCFYVNHTVRDRKGFMVNGRRYHGKVVVPQCLADYLSMMETRHRDMERGVFEDRGRTIHSGEIHGR